MSNFNLLLRPVITEKATAGEKGGKYKFFVTNRATKIEVKETFKKLYGLEVSKINMMRTAKKTRTGKSRKPVTKKPEYKKVIITTKSKKNVDVMKPKLKF